MLAQTEIHFINNNTAKLCCKPKSLQLQKLYPNGGVYWSRRVLLHKTQLLTSLSNLVFSGIMLVAWNKPRIYTMEIGKGYVSGLVFYLPESWDLLNIYWYTTAYVCFYNIVLLMMG